MVFSWIRGEIWRMLTKRSKKFTHKVCKELLERFFKPFVLEDIKERSKMEASESQEPKMCPLLSRLINLETLPLQQEPKRTSPYLHRVPCRHDQCEFWSEKEKVCSFVRKVEYESLLEKIIQSKK